MSIAAKKWFQFKEMSAGVKRLVITYYIYKFFGEIPLKIIAFFVSAITFFRADEQKKASKKYFKILKTYTNKKYNRFSSFIHFINCGFALADKIISFTGNFNPDKFIFQNKDDENEISKLLENKKGIFFITTHLGNPEILRSLLQSKRFLRPENVNILMDRENCKVFNDFLNAIEIKNNIEIYSTDEIGVETGIELDEKTGKGELVFIAGDRVSHNNPTKTVKIDFLGKKVELPYGAFKLAQLLNRPVFFITCVKKDSHYSVLTEKFNTQNISKKMQIENMKNNYGKFCEKWTIEYPYQFYNFFDIFE